MIDQYLKDCHLDYGNGDYHDGDDDDDGDRLVSEKLQHSIKIQPS